MQLEARLHIPTTCFIRDLKIHNVMINNQACMCSDTVQWHSIIGREKNEQELVIDLQIVGWMDSYGHYQEAASQEFPVEALSIEYELIPSFVAQQIQMQIIK
ncbi:hypothetical protein LAV72_18370 [Lysinibacillus xylanilyticus]|uniref:hypothetical protein n=1 Tax=Lysinibacillus xylanilyticus TaxID=582475 RepID=UPI002B2407CB|nr:hypothetical protein [Lysinibacillus xylanilyticus]MEB2301572.1 hypothetical protein [Lysinibacillus xylanilyticus]